MEHTNTQCNRTYSSLLVFLGAAMLFASPCSAEQSGKQARINAQLVRIVIPEIRLEEASVEDMCAALEAESLKNDRAKNGVKIVFKGQNSAPNANMELLHMPVFDAIKFMCKVYGCKYDIRDDAVYITPNANDLKVVQQ